MRRAKWSATLIFVAVLCVAPTGCGGQAPAPGGPTTPAGSVAPSGSAAPSGSVAPSGSTVPGTPLVRFDKQGGIAGVDERLVIQPDGSFDITGRGSARHGVLSPQELTGLRQVLEASRFAEIPAVNPTGGVADAFTYHVVYAGNQVVAVDGGVPTSLGPVLAELDRILQLHTQG
jgi:hypothetical protein